MATELAGKEVAFLFTECGEQVAVLVLRKQAMQARARKQERMILVEGYMDVIGIYAAGIHEVVASSGTSLAIEQVRAIKRQVSLQQGSAREIILNFDADSAGIKLTQKYIGALLAEGLRVKVVEVPGGLDPDEYIQKNGVAAYRQQLDGAVSYFQWLATQAREVFDMGTAQGRVDAFKSMTPIVEQVHDRVERDAIARELDPMEARRIDGSEHEPPIHPTIAPSAVMIALSPGLADVGAATRITVARQQATPVARNRAN